MMARWKPVLWGIIVSTLCLSSSASINPYEGKCYVENLGNASITLFRSMMTYSMDRTYSLVEDCTKSCHDISFPIAALEDASFCSCFEQEAFDKGILNETSTEPCTSKCFDGKACGGPEARLSLYEIAVQAEFVDIFFEDDLNSLKVGTPVKVTVDALYPWIIDWGDGSDHSSNTEHTYTIGGTFLISVYLIPLPMVRVSAYVKVHETPKFDIVCPSLLEVSIPDTCNVTSYRQGYNFELSYNMTNGTSSQIFTALVPEEQKKIVGSLGTETPAGTLTISDDTKIFVPKGSYVQDGGYIFRVRAEAEVAGSLGIYAVTPACTANAYCSATSTCLATCPAMEDTLVCSPIRSDIPSCPSITEGSSPLATFAYQFLTLLSITSTSFDEELAELIWVSAGAQIGFGCVSPDCSGIAKINYQNITGTETADNYLDISATSSSLTSSGRRHMVQIAIREHPIARFDAELHCESAAPFPLLDVTLPFTAATEAHIWEGTLNFSYSVINPLMSGVTATTKILCQQNISYPTFEGDIWMEFGKERPFHLMFSQGSPLFSIFNIDGVLSYDYKDDAVSGYNLSLTLAYKNEGLFLFTGNTTNLLGSVLYNSTIHVVPPVTNNWVLTVLCPCYDIAEGFNYSLKLASAPHPPWNSTIDILLISDTGMKVSLKNVTVDFLTFGKNGTAIALSLEYHAFVETAATYNFTVRMWNEISETLIFSNVIVEEGIRNVTATVLFNFSGNILPPMGSDKNIILTNFTTLFFPDSQRGTPLKWRIVINETGEIIEISGDKNITHVFPQEGDYTVIIGGYNTVQGWVNSLPITLQVVYKIRGFTLTDDGVIKKPGYVKDVIGNFTVFTPLACIFVNYGDDYSETFGYEKRCKTIYPSTPYRGEVQAPVFMDHIYKSEGIYLVKAIASDEEASFTGDLSVVIADIPCTMPVVKIVNGVRLPEMATQARRSIGALIETTASYKCNKSVPVKRWWTLSEIDPVKLVSTRDVLVKEVLPSWNYSQLAVPSNFLTWGIYKATYYLSIIASAIINLERNDFTFINITKTPLQGVMIDGSASMISRGYGQLVNFNPEGLSKDPDYPLDIASLNFTWWCRQVAPVEEILQKLPNGHIEAYNEQQIPDPLKAPPGGGCFGIGAGTILPPIRKKQFNTASFVLQKATYELVLKVHKDDRYEYISLTIEVSPDPPPSVLIKCDPSLCYPASSSLIFNPTNRVVLFGTCTADCSSSMKYQWSIKSLDGKPVITAAPCEQEKPLPNGCTPVFAPQNAAEVVFSTEFFSINPTVEEFRVRLSITTDSQKTGFTEIRIKRNKAPDQGSCKLSITNGFAMITNFEVDCSGWADPEGLGISSYSYFFFREKDGQLLKTVLASTSLVPINLMLPVGNFSLMIEIADKMAGKTIWCLGNVTAELPDKNAIDDFDYLSKISYFSTIGDQTSLAMLLSSLSSIRDNADWLALDENLINNMTTDALTNRLTDVSHLNSNQLKVVHEYMNFETLSQLEVGANVVAQAVGGIFNSNISSLTVDMETREMAIVLLEDMSAKLTDVYVSSPADLESFLASTLEASHALLLGVSQVLTIGETKNMVPPTDHEKAGSLDYNVDIPNDYDMEIPLEKAQMYKQNVLDTTRSNSKKQVERINNALNNTLFEVRKRMVTNEKIETIAAHETYVLIWKLTEEELKNGLEIPVQKGRGKVTLPKTFCPSRNLYPSTDCKKEFAITTVIWPSINYMYPPTVSLLASDTSVIALDFTIENSVVNITNETNGIIIDIPRKCQTETDWHLINAKENMSNYQNIVYHNFNISQYDSGYKIEICPADNEFPSNTVLLIDHERMPTPWKYMKIILVKSLNMDMNGTYTFFASSDENDNKTGRFFVGIAVIKDVSKIGNNLTLSKSDFDENFSSSYYFRAYSSGCYYFDNSAQQWVSNGLKMIGVSNSTVTCLTVHATSFGSGYFRLENKLDFEYIFANPGFVDNLSIYTTLIILIGLYIIMLIWGHWMDKKDFQRHGVIPLPDNTSEDKYLYEVTFHTGPDKEATTDSNIKFILSGDYCETDVRSLPPATSFLYRRFAVNSFVMATSGPLGNISFLRVFHDNTGEPPLDTWQLQMAVVRDLQTAEKYIFDVNGWLAFDRDEGKIDRIFSLSDGDEKWFSQNLYIRSNKATNQDHMWMSMFLRPLGSRYGRKERVTVCFVFLFCSMLLSALWHDASPESKKNSLMEIGPFTFSVSVLLTGLCVLLISFPLVYFLSFIFKRARPKNLKRCRALDSIEKQRKIQLEEQGLGSEEVETQSKVEVNDGKKARPKDEARVKCIPWWTRILAWILSFALIAVSVFFVWSFGIMWGEIKTSKWLSSFLLSFFLSILIVQWIKVAFVSCLSSTVAKYDLSTEDIDCDEELPSLKMDESWYHQKILDPSIRRKVYKVEGVDTENAEIDKLRRNLGKNREMKIVLRDIIRYCVFLAVILIISSERTDRNGILLKTHFEATFVKQEHEDFDFASKVGTTDDWWMWAKNGILQELRAQNTYDNKPPYGLRGYLNDQANRILGYAILRQIRTKRYNCAAPKPLDTVIDRCTGERGLYNEETKNFCAGWTVNATFDGACKWSEFKYKTSDELKTYPSLGKMGWYGGGGYVIRLSGPQDDLLKRMDELQRNKWIDRNTRVVILEFSTYNANVNLFSICTITAEVNEGTIVPTWRFEPFKLIKKPGLQGVVYYLCEIMFVFSLVIFTIEEFLEIKKLKLIYFESYWNIAEICILLLSYITVGLYFYRYVLTQEALKVFNITRGNGYIRMDSAALIDNYYLYGMAIIVFFSILKLIKLLQFNKRMDVLTLTIKACWEDLKMYLFAFVVLFFAFVCLFLFIFSSSLEDFAQLVRALLTTFDMMMGKFDSQEMNDVNPLSPLLFFVFSFTNNMIMINLTLTVVIQAFSEVKADLENKENKLNIIDFVWSSFKQFIRVENLPKIHVDPKLTDKIDRTPGSSFEESDSHQLPDKIDQLVQYINNVYFDGRLDINDPNIRKSFMKTSTTEGFVPLKERGIYDAKKILGGDD